VIEATPVKFTVLVTRPPGLTQRALARAMGWSPGYMCRVERGDATISAEQLARLRAEISSLTSGIGQTIVPTACEP
jgi:transcriptional regulator with XRE-family HTH domain